MNWDTGWYSDEFVVASEKVVVDHVVQNRDRLFCARIGVRHSAPSKGKGMEGVNQQTAMSPSHFLFTECAAAGQCRLLTSSTQLTRSRIPHHGVAPLVGSRWIGWDGGSERARPVLFRGHGSSSAA